MLLCPHRQKLIRVVFLAFEQPLFRESTAHQSARKGASNIACLNQSGLFTVANGDSFNAGAQQEHF